MNETAYIAGPMTGYPRYNFDMFDKVRDHLIRSGLNVISPADLDREVGFDPDTSVVDSKFLDEAMKRDIDGIMKADFIVMLPGWRKSTGAKAEYALAKWRHIPVYVWNGEYAVPEAYATKDAKGETSEDCNAPLPETTAIDPKKAVGDTKCPVQLLPPVALEHTAWVQGLGAKKYGPWNWRRTGVVRSTYIGAIFRHLMAIHSGEWLDQESGKPHAAHIAASCNILMDADAHGKLDHEN